MPLNLQGTSKRLTSDRNDVVNDTGRVAFCGPFVISAVTGYPVSRVEDEIRHLRGVPDDAKPIKGTYTEEVTAALGHFGYAMKPVRSYLHLARKERPSVWGWMQFPRNAWAHYILAVHKGNVGHWILIKGVKLCDTYSQGKWEFVCDGPHKGARIMEIFEVKRAIDLNFYADPELPERGSTAVPTFKLVRPTSPHRSAESDATVSEPTEAKGAPRAPTLAAQNPELHQSAPFVEYSSAIYETVSTSEPTH